MDPPRVVVGPYVAPATRYGAGHRGIDLAASAGAPVYAPADGVVYFAGIVVNRPVLSIRHADGLMSSYEPVTSVLAAGAIVHRGDLVGTVQIGAEQFGTVQFGHCPTSCLHFGVRLYGEYVSPLLYLGGIVHSVLLPTRRLR